MLARAQSATSSNLGEDIDRLTTQCSGTKIVRLLTTDGSGPGAPELAARLSALVERGFEIRVLFSSITDMRDAKAPIAPYIDALGAVRTRASIRFATFRRAHELHPCLLVGRSSVPLDGSDEQHADASSAVVDAGEIMMFDFLFNSAARPSAALLRCKQTLPWQILSHCMSGVGDIRT